MPVTQDGMGSFGALAQAMGITDGTSANSAWFGDPMATGSNPHGLSTILGDDDQRNALVDFVDEALGPPDLHRSGEQKWIPLFAETDPAITVYVVLEPVVGAVRVGVGLEHRAGTGVPNVKTTLHVPIFHVPRGTDSRPADPSLPRWLLLGRPGGRIGIGIEADFTDTPPVAGAAYLRGASVQLAIPTAPIDTVGFSLTLTDLQLPGAQAPQSRTLDLESLATVGADVLEFVVGLVRQQVEALDPNDHVFRHIVGLAGMLGLRHVEDLNPLPLVDLPTQGLGALVAWVETVLQDDQQLDLWLAQLALVIGGVPDVSTNSVSFDIGPAHLALGLRVTPGTGGHPVLVPWVDVTWSPGVGADLVASIDLFRADTATGRVTAVPGLSAQAVFGAAAHGGSALLTGTPGVVSIRTGLALDPSGKPAFTLTLHGVTLPGGVSHDVVDLSSPQAAVAAVDSVVTTALTNALAGFGAAADAVERLLGITAPGGVTAVTASALVADPLGAIRRYWHDLLVTGGAMAEVLGALSHLLTGTSTMPTNAGTAVDPWVVDLVPGVGLRAWRDGDTLVLALGADTTVPVLTGLVVAARADLVLLKADLGAGHLALACAGSGSVLLRPAGADPMVLDLDLLTLRFGGLGIRVDWAPVPGLACTVVGDGLSLGWTDPRTRLPQVGAIPLPQVSPSGEVTFTPDWGEVEGILAALLGRVRSSVVDTLLELVGWRGRGAHLRLADLVAHPATAVEDWLVDLALDCVNLRTALGPVAYLLSGGLLAGPLGGGRPTDPYRCPVTGDPRAPGIAVWTVPGCPLVGPLGIAGPGYADLRDGVTAPDGPTIAAALRSVAPSVPEIADLLVGRAGLGAGLTSLVTRWTGTDGVVGVPAVPPAGVTPTVLTGLSYAEMVAAGRTGSYVLDEVAVATDSVVHVGCSEDWLTGSPTGHGVDATVATPAAMAAAETGVWFVRLPVPATAAAVRTDHDAVAGQAERLVAVLAARTAPVVVVGYGPAGAAVLRAARSQPLVTAVVTVGTPWAEVVLTSLTTGLGGDAVRLLQRFVPDPLPFWTDELAAISGSPLRRGWELVRRAASVTATADLPSAAGEVLPGAAEVHALFGAVSEPDARAALAAVVVAGIDARAAAATAATAASTGPPTEVHVGVDLPVLDLDLGGLLVSIGARVDLVSARHATPHLQPLREVVVDVHLGVTDGWLVGGPGAGQSQLEVRWVEATAHIPLGGGDGTTQLVLHEARAYTAYREAWVVSGDGDGTTATTALPEVKILLSEVAARLRTAAPSLADLLTHLGIVRSDGVDPDAIDHLLRDPAGTIRPVVVSAAAQVAGDLRTLMGLNSLPADLAPTAIRVGVGPASLDVDLSVGRVSGDFSLVVPGLPPLEVALTAQASGVAASAAVGAFVDGVGGTRLVGSFGSGGAHLAVESRAPGATGTTSVGLYPSVDVPGLTGLGVAIVPAAVTQTLMQWCRTEASAGGLAALDAGLGALGLLGPAAPSGAREVVLPVGLFSDPGAWLRTRSDPLATTVALLEALAPIVVPDRPPATAGWPVGDALTIGYAVTGGRLHLTGDLTLTPDVGGQPVTVQVTGGLSIGTDGVVAPVMDAEVLLGGSGLRLGVSPAMTLDLVREAPAPAVRLYPAGAGLADAVGAAAESAVRVILNAVVGHRNDGSATDVRAVARALHELGSGLDLLVADEFTDGRIAVLASNPAAYLETHLAGVVGSGLSALALALDPTHAVVTVGDVAGGTRRVTLGTTTPVHIDLDGTTPAISVGFDLPLRDESSAVVGHLALQSLRLSPQGVQVDVRCGPFVVAAGPVTLRPVVVVRAGVTSGGFSRLVSVGLALDDAGAQSVEVRWAVDGNAPEVCAVDRAAGVETGEDRTPAGFATRVLAVALDLAASVLTEQLGTVVTGRATGMLQGVLFTGGVRRVDTTLFADLTHPEALLHRLEVLLWNCATDPAHGANPVRPLGVTIDGTVTIALASEDLSAGRKQVGLNVSLVPGKKFLFPTSDVTVALEVDASWISHNPQPGLSIFVLAGPDADHLAISPAFLVAGLGMRFTKSAGPLLELGSIALDGIAVHVYAEANPAGVGGGANLELVGLAVAPGGGQGTGVANKIMNDVGSSSANNRPTFSPSLAIQKHPGPSESLEVGLRAGEPPGPWWLVIQRQLGPLYVDRIGLGTVESGGRVTEISLLFTGQLSIFGLTAAVDQLSITWHGGDVLSISSWSVDLMGLAISANFSGLSLSGGLLKTVDGGTTSYVGMLMGRFAAYGLTVFGGYTSDHGNASFFIFGAINGPIGGPPAFFLTGLGGGLGINRALVIPTDLSRFGEFPFIQALDPAAKPPANPMDELHALAAYFPHRMGNFWFAAGVSFTCFSLIDGVAVVAVSFGNGLDIDLLGLARMALPRPQAAIVSIELALLVHFSTEEGVFLMKAQLTDNSWLLYPDVRLTGGFAMALWWKGPLSGQFVLSMGGYHPSFHRDGYPVVPRLGILWRISDVLVIKGESYFALTSEALMAGVKVQASLDLGWVWARVEFGADGIVYFDPFWFEVSAYARISAGIHIDLGWFGTISFSVTLGASITVWGPKFAGRVEFEIGPATVPISFGNPDKALPPPVPWSAFVAKYLEVAGGAARTLSGITGKGALPTATTSETGAPSADGSQTLPYQVFAEFELLITTTAPATHVDVAGEHALPVTLNGQAVGLGLSPMQAHDLSSKVVVSLQLRNPNTGVYAADARLARLATGIGPNADGPRWSLDYFPVGVWGPPGADLPQKAVPHGDVVQAGKQLVLVAGIQGSTVGPQIDYHQVVARPKDRRPLPLLATGTDRKKFLNVALGLADLPAQDVVTPEDAIALAAARIFADRELTGIRGGHSAVARAAYRQDRSAPPLFGTLTDGLAPANAGNGDRTVLDAPAPVEQRVLRAPFVAGYLTGGVGAAARPTGTTVSDGRLKRRPAPTVASVQGRLALHLPVTLTRGAPPSVAASGTLLATGAVPRTDVVGAARSYAGGRQSTPGLQSLVAGLGGAGAAPRATTRGGRRPRPLADPIASTIRSGDVVALQLQDAAYDVAEDRRPALTVRGKARVIVIRGRSVLFDDDVVDGTVPIPRGATHVGVHADGDADPTGGFAGWHDRTRVARLGGQTAIAAGCVVSTAATGGVGVLSWDAAGALAHETAEVTTRFARPVTTVAVALTGSAPSSLDPTQLHLVGARVATDRAGADRLPVAVTLGATSVLVYPVVPDEGATFVSVEVTAGSAWVVSGVVGADVAPADLARSIAAHGLSAVTAKVLAVAGPGCAVEWSAPPPATAPRTAKKATVKKAARGPRRTS